MDKLIVVVFFFLIIIIFSVKLYLYQKSKDRSGEKFPPFKSMCPDYWKVIRTESYKDENGIERLAPVCENIHQIGKCRAGKGRDAIMDFTKDPYTGQMGDKFKCMWSKKCGSPWQGYSNLC